MELGPFGSFLGASTKYVLCNIDSSKGPCIRHVQPAYSPKQLLGKRPFSVVTASAEILIAPGLGILTGPSMSCSTHWDLLGLWVLRSCYCSAISCPGDLEPEAQLQIHEYHGETSNFM